MEPKPSESKQESVNETKINADGTPCIEVKEGCGLMRTIEIMLKWPRTLAWAIKEKRYSFSWAMLLGLLIFSGIYGVIVGSFSGGEQWYAAPVKIMIGLTITSVICFPSLYIFSCLSGADVTPAQTATLLLCGVTLSTLLLIGFAPVAWVFSESTNSIGFMGVLHLAFWGVSLAFGIRFIINSIEVFNVGKYNYLFCWVVVFVITSFQMTTALRPILGKADTFLPTEKKFFLQYWFEDTHIGR